jgi:uncharacterized protein (DUF4213/DUF364 family)
MSALAREIVDGARRIAAALRPPRVARVLVPGEAGAHPGGAFCALELEDGSAGICYAALDETREELRAAAVGPWAGRDAAAVAEGFASGDAAARALGLAAVNALTRHLLDRAGFRPDFATSSLGSLALAPGDRLGMVGFFPPLVRRAREQGVPLTVLELKSELVQDAEGLTVTLDPARLGECTKVVCTSTTLLNDSLEAVLAHARPASEFVLIGPSAGCAPDPLFARGVTAVGGAWVADAPALFARAARNERWGDATRKSSLRRADWPGLDALLARAVAPG